MGLFHPTNRVFSAITESLGFLEADAATTEYENGPVKPRLNIELSVQKSAVWRSFTYRIVQGIGSTVTQVFDFFTSTAWTAIEVNNRNDLAGNVVPAAHEALVVGVGVLATVDIGPGSLSMQRRRSGAAIVSNEPLYWGDQSDNGIQLTRNVTHDSPVLRPLPWYFPPLAVFDARLVIQSIANNATEYQVVLDVLSAPPGVFSRIW